MLYRRNHKYKNTSIQLVTRELQCETRMRYSCIFQVGHSQNDEFTASFADNVKQLQPHTSLMGGSMLQLPEEKLLRLLNNYIKLYIYLFYDPFQYWPMRNEYSCPLQRISQVYLQQLYSCQHSTRNSPTGCVRHSGIVIQCRTVTRKREKPQPSQ